MNGTIGLQRHGKPRVRMTPQEIASYLRNQQAPALPATPQPNIRQRNPSTIWRKDAKPRYRAEITLHVTTVDGTVTQASASVYRGFYFGGHRTYKNITPASVARMSRLFPIPVMDSDERLADRMLRAGYAHAQAARQAEQAAA